MGTWSIEIKSYPQLSLEVMRRRLESQYRVWLIARHLDRRGRGYIPVKMLRRFVVRHRLCTRKTLQRALDGPSIFWTGYYHALYLVGVCKVADALDVELSHRPVFLPLAAFSSIHQLRSVFVASYFAAKPRTIAIDTLAALTGRTRRSVSRYLESGHITKTSNFMRSVREPGPTLDPALAEQGYFRANIRAQTVLVKRMPNTYESDLDTAPRGITRKQSTRPSSYTVTAPPIGESPPLPPAGSAVPALRGATRRRYFRKPKGARRALQSLSPHQPVYIEARHSPKRPPGQFWEGYTVLERSGPPVRL